jgi:hypothetical protein
MLISDIHSPQSTVVHSPLQGTAGGRGEMYFSLPELGTFRRAALPQARTGCTGALACVFFWGGAAAQKAVAPSTQQLGLLFAAHCPLGLCLVLKPTRGALRPHLSPPSGTLSAIGRVLQRRALIRNFSASCKNNLQPCSVEVLRSIFARLFPPEY